MGENLPAVQSEIDLIEAWFYGRTEPIEAYLLAKPERYKFLGEVIACVLELRFKDWLPVVQDRKPGGGE